MTEKPSVCKYCQHPITWNGFTWLHFGYSQCVSVARVAEPAEPSAWEWCRSCNATGQVEIHGKIETCQVCKGTRKISTAPQPVAGEGPRCTIHGCGNEAVYGGAYCFKHSQRHSHPKAAAPEGTPKLEEIVLKITETVLRIHRGPNETIFDYQPRVESAIADILRPVITPACSPPICDGCGAGPMLDRGGFYDCFACGHNREKEATPAPQWTMKPCPPEFAAIMSRPADWLITRTDGATLYLSNDELDRMVKGHLQLVPLPPAPTSVPQAGPLPTTTNEEKRTRMLGFTVGNIQTASPKHFRLTLLAAIGWMLGIKFKVEGIPFGR